MQRTGLASAHNSKGGNAKLWLRCCTAVLLLAATSVAFAGFHLFRFDQMYTNADGSVQFVVMREIANANGENQWAGLTLTSTGPEGVKTFDFPFGLPSPNTAGRRVLIATQSFAALGLITPDFVIPDGFLPLVNGTVNFASVDQMTYSALPVDGVTALSRSGAMVPNLATNFAGQSVALSAPPPTNRNYQGLWYNAPAESESGWGVNFAHQGDVIFLTWFTYDASGKAWWLTMTAERTANNVYGGDFFETRGPAFNAVPFSPTAVTIAKVGDGTLTFTDANNGTFRYTVNGIQQTKNITRQVFGPLPTCRWGMMSDLALATNFQDLWWAAPAGVESGWGVNFTHQGDAIFATWFTYDFDGTPLWLSATAFKAAPGVYGGALIRTAGPAFNAVPFNPAAVTRTEVGTLTITFAHGNSATYRYQVALGNPPVMVDQTKTVTRQVFRMPGTACQ